MGALNFSIKPVNIDGVEYYDLVYLCAEMDELRRTQFSQWIIGKTLVLDEDNRQYVMKYDVERFIKSLIIN